MLYEVITLRDAGGYLVRLKDVGRSEIAAENERTVVRFKGEPAVALGVVKQATANPLDISREVRAMVPRIEAAPDAHAGCLDPYIPGLEAPAISKYGDPLVPEPEVSYNFV